MKTELLKIVRSTQRPGQQRFNKRFYAFIVCLFIASLFWLLISLSKNYESSLVFPVHYKLPPNRVTVTPLPKQITMHISARGFTLLAYHFNIRETPVEIDLSSLENFESENDGKSVSTRKLLEKTINKISPQARLVTVTPERIYVELAVKVSKKVPVKVISRLSFEKQHDLSDSIRPEPSSVKISGSREEINRIKFIATQPITLNDLDETTTVEADLEIPARSGIDASVKKVKVAIPVQKFTEHSLEIPVEITGQKGKKQVKIIPDKVKVTFQVGLSDFEKVTAENFRAVVDVSPKAQLTRKLKVELVKKPGYIRSVKISPAKVDYIIRK